MSVQELELRLGGLRGERDVLTSSRTREDVRALAENWLAAACSRANGTAAGFVLNGHVGPTEVQAMLGEYLLHSPALVEFITAKVEATTSLISRQRDRQVEKLGLQIVELERELFAARKAEAMAQLEAEFAPEAA